jgi:3-dehydroquinate synthase
VVADPAVRVLADAISQNLAAAGVALPRQPVHFAGGEESKSLAGLEGVLRYLAAAGIDRSGCVVAAGGGSVGDLAGFAAAVWLRGITYYHVPTTLLAMVDSSVGGKAGINFDGMKNAVGAFWQPAAVVSDLECLSTLPQAEFRAAFGEIVKYAVAMDAGLFHLLSTRAPDLLARDLAALEDVILRCVRAKARVVVEDELDRKGVRAILNYGHTVGHALEAASGYEISHGCAVAHGMRAAARVAAAIGFCAPEVVEAQDRLLAAFALPGPAPDVAIDAVMSALPKDKKSESGAPRWVLPREIGRAETGVAAPPDKVRAAVAEALAA